MTTPDRKLICLRLVSGKRGVNRCESEQLPGSTLCAHHLAEAAADYRRITQDALAEAGDGTE